MQPVAVLNVVALSKSLLPHAPRLRALAEAKGCANLRPPFPAVTCTAQSSMLTGLPVAGHGIVANGWFHDDTQEVRFWLQSNKLVAGEKVWDAAKQRDPSFTCLNMFWWFNMYSSCDWSVTPRPQYRADGRKVPDCYSEPPELRDELQAQLGTFPLFRFWGPLADITSTQWIADATKIVWDKKKPTLTLVYLPHLDYPLQKLGPDHADIPNEVAKVDAIVGDLLDFFEARGVKVIVVSEYGIEPAAGASFPNRVLREAGYLNLRLENGRELLDAGASRAFAVCDHQAALVYVRDPADEAQVRALLSAHGQVRENTHPHGGAFALEAVPGAWFAHDWWPDDAKAPDYQKTVDIHRKPGYDPRELFSDKSMPQIAWRLLKRKLGFRTLLDVVPLDAGVVKGSHGRVETAEGLAPLLIGAGNGGEMAMESVKAQVLREVFGEYRLTEQQATAIASDYVKKENLVVGAILAVRILKTSSKPWAITFAYAGAPIGPSNNSVACPPEDTDTCILVDDATGIATLLDGL